jgi:hypothetical protein
MNTETQRTPPRKRAERTRLNEREFDRLVVLLFDVGWIDVTAFECPWVH